MTCWSETGYTAHLPSPSRIQPRGSSPCRIRQSPVIPPNFVTVATNSPRPDDAGSGGQVYLYGFRTDNSIVKVLPLGSC